MLISKIKAGCRVGFFGLGSSNSSLLCCLPLGNCSVTLRADGRIDRSVIPSYINVERVFEGNEACRDIDEDIIIFSPSVRRDRKEFTEAANNGVIFTSDAELFFEESKRPLFAVTGSDGKSTTAAITQSILLAGGINAVSVGNMGEPMVRQLNSNADIFVAELSSFMLTYTKPRAKRACLTNLTPNHLDWHKNFEEYKKTKISLLESSKEFVISDDSIDIRGAYGIVSADKSFKELIRKYTAEVYMTAEDGNILRNGKILMSISSIKKQEKHNIKNLMMAIAMTDGFADINSAISVAESFGGLAHRCELFLTSDGVEYFDSSIDTSPARTCATLSSLGRRAVVILGGKSKGLNYRELIPTLESYAEHTIICGENAAEIYEAIKESVNSEIADDLESAAERGIYEAKKVGVLLLSPASASYDKYKNFAERGDKFKEIIRKKLGK